jgi:parallel beta-helix repeat protein
MVFAMESVQAELITVCEEGCNYANITAAVAFAKPGDVLEVQSGTYRENINVTKPIILRGMDTGKDRPVVDAGKKGSAIILSADGIVVDGFEVRTAVNHPFKEWAGIRIASNDNVISNNLATDNDNGIFLAGFSNNTLLGNNATMNINGIRLERSNDNIIKANYFSRNNYGLRLTSSNDNILAENHAEGNEYGILLESSQGNVLEDNLMNGNLYNFGADGSNNVSTSNLVDNKPVYYLIDALGKVVDSDSQAGTVYCIGCENVTIKDLTLKNNMNGILLENTTNCKIETNEISNNSCGIEFTSSKKNVIRNNYITNSLNDGFTLDSSDNNTIEYNTVFMNGHYGVSLWYSAGNELIRNNISTNNNGLGINYSNYTIVEEDTISFNKINGLLLRNSIENHLAQNSINNNLKGFWMIFSSTNEIADNTIFSNVDGIRLEFSKNNTISRNKIYGNKYGILLDPKFINLIENNEMENNKNDLEQIVSSTTARAPGPHKHKRQK